jgi:hypothetical protein
VSALTVADLNTSISAEPRVMDLRLAEVLGFAHPRRIRVLIRRHLDALKRFGEVRTTVVQTSALGGRPSKASWLNRKQALYVCTKSETERATDISIEVIEVYDAYLAGRAQRHAEVPALSRSVVRRPALRRSQRGVGMMMLDGLIRFDRRILPLAGDAVLVIGTDGQPRVDRVADYDGQFRRGFVWVQAAGHPHGRAWEQLAVLGVVTTAAGNRRRAMRAAVDTPMTITGFMVPA